MTTDVGDVVLDPFLGTGTTAIAAKKLQRHYIGIDIDPTYAQIAQDKLSKIKQPTLYQGFPVSIFLGNIQSIRDCDAAQLFPKQLTSPEKKQKRAEQRKKALNGVKQLSYTDSPLPY
jgi:site-specific DNA-methyltransferase (adenine-specific)